VVSCGGWRVPRLLLALSVALVPGATCSGSGRCHAGQAGHPARPSARAVQAAATGVCCCRLLLCRVSRPLHAQHLPWNWNGRLPGWVATSCVWRYWTAQGGKPGARTAARRRAAAAAAVEPGSEDGAAVAATGKRGARKRKQAGA